ncbi:Large ribosomal subunit protein uL1c-like protein [Drosera capensis]
MEFDKLIASPDMMPKVFLFYPSGPYFFAATRSSKYFLNEEDQVASLRRLLGPKGLMPSPKAGTVTPNIPQNERRQSEAPFTRMDRSNYQGLAHFFTSRSSAADFKRGKVAYRGDKSGIVHLPFGKLQFSEEDLLENFLATDNMSSCVKKVYWRSAYICTSMGPSIKLDVKDMLALRVAASKA